MRDAFLHAYGIIDVDTRHPFGQVVGLGAYAIDALSGSEDVDNPMKKKKLWKQKRLKNNFKSF